MRSKMFLCALMFCMLSSGSEARLLGRFRNHCHFHLFRLRSCLGCNATLDQNTPHKASNSHTGCFGGSCGLPTPPQFTIPLEPTTNPTVLR